MNIKTIWSRTAFSKLVGSSPCKEQLQKRYYFSSCNNKNENDKEKTEKKARAPVIPSFMPVVNIPVTELAQNAFYSLHRPLLGLSIPQPFLVGDIVGQIKEEDTSCSEEQLAQYMSTLRPFEPPAITHTQPSTTTTLTVEVDPSYFMNHNNNHDEIADYLTAMQEKLDILYDEKCKTKTTSFISTKKKTKRLRKRKGFFEKN
ncbi:hypothetical protein HPULCUR_002888 [Helicostylum pulchrum]|uniref:Mitochondrial mRNA-processing protein COX24 C-terminal domain-containing protein n=1 Tax=Helicostylum pulchrum TaxID=562976 RepID=A0ABP9XT18_9FUNG